MMWQDVGADQLHGSMQPFFPCFEYPVGHCGFLPLLLKAALALAVAAALATAVTWALALKKELIW